MVHDKHNPEDMDSDKEDHACDALRYDLNAWLRPSRPAPKTPEQLEADWAEQTVRARRSQLIGSRQEAGQGWKV